ncbi:uncharacterized protein LOC128240771 isoform X2 [Mya arenaria]|uniref:uncharacterized protein LOC128240771 isoform X2 n=1 Tax=Mya arenaria TaxID=6604 RepID=UPI0022E734C2|nr:uncharacterized protein LOC128240771 isoform X2 [Mya arenaria]
MANFFKQHFKGKTRASRKDRIQEEKHVLSYVSNPRTKVALYVVNKPVSESNNYFELEILNTGEIGAVAIGLVPADYPDDSQPGWREKSIAYHADDGSLFKENGSGISFGPKCGNGDRMGCGVRFMKQSLNEVEVYFTKNGHEIGCERFVIPRNGLFPAVGMHSDGEKVRLDMDATFRSYSKSAIKAKTTKLEKRATRADFVAIHGDRLSYVSNPRTKVALYVVNKPVSESNNYFELEILNTGEIGAVAIGLVPADYPDDSQPGWREKSIAYHADDGSLFKENGSGISLGPKCGNGDRMGCGVRFMKQSLNEVEVYFTKNGHEIGCERFVIPRNGLFPAVGMHSDGEKVRLDIDATFRSYSKSAIKAKTTELEKRATRADFVAIHGDRLSYVSNPRTKVALYVVNKPVSESNNYFELEILNTGEIGAVAIGLVPADYPDDSQPGWKEKSIAYHADDGSLFKENGSGISLGPKCGNGDRMGCGVRFMKQSLNEVEVYFTKNGHEIGCERFVIPRNGLFPAVGMHSDGEKVRLDMDVTFRSYSKSAIKAKTTELEKRATRADFVAIHGDRLSYLSNPRTKVALYVVNKPVSESNNYFELEILNTGEIGAVAIGLVPADYPDDSQPGWREKSIAYHADDGSLFKENGSGISLGPKCGNGDRMGCGVRFMKQSLNEVEVYFTKNGHEIGCERFVIPRNGLFPAVGMHSDGEKVRLDMDATFRSYSKSAIKAKTTELEKRATRADFVAIHGDRLSYVSNPRTKVALYVVNKPVSESNNYFELEILNTGEIGAVAIGLVPADYPDDSQPGWREKSIAYHADDGSLFKENGSGISLGPKCGNGDRMGCGVRFMKQSLNEVEVYFTKNGHEIGCERFVIPRNGLFPAVGMHSDGEKVRLDMDATFRSYSKSAIKAKTTELEKRATRADFVAIHGDRLSYVSNPRTKVALYVVNKPVSESNNYFELEILNTGEIGAVAIGLVPADYPDDSQPGWREKSIAYHADDGRLFKENGSGISFGPKCGNGDKMGCGVRFMKQSLNEVEVYFTRNSQEVGARLIQLPSGGFYPAVGMHSNGENVRIFTPKLDEADRKQQFPYLTVQLPKAGQGHAKTGSSEGNDGNSVSSEWDAIDELPSDSVPGRKRIVDDTDNASDFVPNPLESGLHNEMCDSVPGRRRGDDLGDSVDGHRRRHPDRK